MLCRSFRWRTASSAVLWCATSSYQPRRSTHSCCRTRPVKSHSTANTDDTILFRIWIQFSPLCLRTKKNAIFFIDFAACKRAAELEVVDNFYIWRPPYMSYHVLTNQAEIFNAKDLYGPHPHETSKLFLHITFARWMFLA